VCEREIRFRVRPSSERCALRVCVLQAREQSRPSDRTRLRVRFAAALAPLALQW